MPSATVVIPALDEESSIGPVLQAIPPHLVDEVIVVDGGSRDGTAAVAAACGARVVVERRRGYGRACALGAAEARGEVVVFLDADGAADPRDIAVLLAPIAERPGRSGPRVAARRLDGRRGHAVAPAVRQSRVRSTRSIFSMARLLPILDRFAPFAAHSWRRCPLDDLTYGWPTEMIVRAARAGWRITEVPVSCNPRTGGRSKISGTIRGTTLAMFHILGTIARHVRR